MSSSEDENQFNEEQIKEIKRISNLKRKEHGRKFQVSGWENDTEGVEEELDPHSTPEAEILWAAENGNLELVKKLVASNRELINVRDKDDYTPLHRACYNDHADVVEFLLSVGSDYAAKTIDHWQPLHSACRWNSALCAAKLLDCGADINCQSQGGQTPLHLAASNGEAKETLQLLLTNPKINTSIKNDNRETAYDIALRSGKYYKLFSFLDPAIIQIL